MIKKIILWLIDIIPIFIIHIVNFFRYKIIYPYSIVSAKAMLFKTKLWYQTRVGGEVWCFNCEIWDFSYLNSWLWWKFWNQITSNLTNVEIWKFCSIWPNLQIPWWNHKVDNITTFPIHSIINRKDDDKDLSLIHIWRCRRSTLCRSRWSPYH